MLSLSLHKLGPEDVLDDTPPPAARGLGGHCTGSGGGRGQLGRGVAVGVAAGGGSGNHGG